MSSSNKKPKFCRHLVAVSLLVALLSSCQEDDSIAPPLISEASVLRNSEPWANLTVQSSLLFNCNPPEPDLGFSIIHENEQGFERERIVVGRIPTVPDLYEPVPFDFVYPDCGNKKPVDASLYFSTADGDVGDGGAPLDTTANNWIEISRYDTVRQELWGSFELTFIDTLRNDTLRFTEGEFHTSVLPDTRGGT